MFAHLKLTPRDFKELITEIKGDRATFVEFIKAKFLTWGFRGRLPYADRIDKSGRLQLTWMCTHNKFFHRDDAHHIGCPFKVQFRSTNPGEPKGFKVEKAVEYHNHHFETAIEYDENNPLTAFFFSRGELKPEPIVRKQLKITSQAIKSDPEKCLVSNKTQGLLERIRLAREKKPRV